MKTRVTVPLLRDRWFESIFLQQGVTCEPNVNYRFRFVVARPHVVAMCAGVAWSRLYDGSEQDPDACGYPHGQRTPERDPYYARHDTCPARSRGQRTQKCQEKQ